MPLAVSNDSACAATGHARATGTGETEKIESASKNVVLAKYARGDEAEFAGGTGSRRSVAHARGGRPLHASPHRACRWNGTQRIVRRSTQVGTQELELYAKASQIELFITLRLGVLWIKAVDLTGVKAREVSQSR